jgi:DNA topoisomerase-1
MDDKKISVYDIEKHEKSKKPYAPFTTSSLQQEANRKLNFTSKKTMMVAQQLYEGISIKGEGSVGLVTYIRTDSFRLSDEAMESAKDYIIQNFGEKYYFSRVYTKAKKTDVKVQDAHEAIRPTSLDRDPEKIKENLTADQYKLYSLIWKRFVSCQMADALYNITTITFNSNNNIFKTSGSILIFDGYKKVYQYSDGTDDKVLPEINENEELDINKIDKEQHFTQPPSRYNEATLIKAMEVMGIGRPSTYAPTITTITSREYVVKDKGSLLPTDMGFLVTEMLEKYFSTIINNKFTAEMENNLDEIASGKVDWHEIINNFYKEFKVHLDVAEKEMEKIEIKDEVSDVKCDNCGEFMVIKKGRYGKFLACPNYPECKNTKPLKDKESVEETDIDCDKCGKKMVKRKGRFGAFLACSNYPECKNTKPIIHEIDVNCPMCNNKLAIKFNKSGRRFFGCSNYPDCKFVTWNEPTNEKCQICSSMLVKKNEKLVCTNKNCGKEEK